MTSLASLWLPILLSAVFVFVMSSLLHMVLPWHRTDYSKVPNEDAVSAALRGFSIPPGDYMMPSPDSRAEMASPKFAFVWPWRKCVLIPMTLTGTVSP